MCLPLRLPSCITNIRHRNEVIEEQVNRDEVIEVQIDNQPEKILSFGIFLSDDILNSPLKEKMNELFKLNFPDSVKVSITDLPLLDQKKFKTMIYCDISPLRPGILTAQKIFKLCEKCSEKIYIVTLSNTNKSCYNQTFGDHEFFQLRYDHNYEVYDEHQMMTALQKAPLKV